MNIDIQVFVFVQLRSYKNQLVENGFINTFLSMFFLHNNWH